MTSKTRRNLLSLVIIKTKIIIPQACVNLNDIGYFVRVRCDFHGPKHFQVISFSHLSTLIILDEGYSRHAPCALNMISTFLIVEIYVILNVYKKCILLSCLMVRIELKMNII